MRIAFSSAVPALFVAVVSSLSAGIFLTINLATIVFYVSLFKNEFLHALSALLHVYIFGFTPSVYLIFKFTLIPNFIGILIVFITLHLKNHWIRYVRGQSLYAYGAGYGVIICLIALICMAQDTPDDLQDILMLLFIMLVAAVASGIFTLRCISALMEYKFPIPTNSIHSEQLNR